MVQSLDDYMKSDRPQSFRAFLGYEKWFENLNRRLSDERTRLSHQPIALVGPRGVGKMTLAKLYAQAIVCEREWTARADWDPCGVCDECRAFEFESASFAYVEQDVRSMSKEADQGEAVRALIDRDGELNTAMVRIVVFNNAEYFTESAADIALKTLETEISKTIYIFIVNDADRFSAALRSRCSVYLVGPIQTEELVARLSFVCERRSVPFHHKALLAIAMESAGSYAVALEILSRVEDHGDATLGSLLRTPEFGWGATMLACWRAALAGRRDEAVSLFEMIGANGESRVKAVQAFLVECYRLVLDPSLKGACFSPALSCLPDEDWRAILKDWDEWCKARGPSLTQVIDPILEFWANVRTGVPSTPCFLMGYNVLINIENCNKSADETLCNLSQKAAES